MAGKVRENGSKVPLDYWLLVLIASCFKLLLLNSYRSTDFEVHRNWLAITHSLPLSKWYYDNTSEWTLDYPPFFAYFEWGLAEIATFFDTEMLVVENLNYSSPMTIFFQKSTVILTDLVLAFGVLRIADALKKKSAKYDAEDLRTKFFILIFINGGLFLVDQMHFQYNGFLFGILLLSIASILEDKFIQGALLFSTLLNLKHIYLYVAPAFGVYLLRRHCLDVDGWKIRFHFKNFLYLALSVLLSFGVSFGPFYQHIPQILSRLFPFKRGLSHAYWAPNMWALYNTIDIGANLVLNKQKSALTGGLVGEAAFAVLPQIQPIHTLGLTLLFMLPILWKVFRSPSHANFINAVVLTAWTSFMFGYHVHEKAILNVLIPFSIIAHCEPELFLMTLTAGTFSLFPLLFTPYEVALKMLIGSLHITMCTWNLSPVKFNWAEKLYLVGFLPLFFIEEFMPFALPKYPFLPLILVSDYCLLGMLFTYVKFYWNSLHKDYDVKLGWTTKAPSSSPPKRQKKRN